MVRRMSSTRITLSQFKEIVQVLNGSFCPFVYAQHIASIVCRRTVSDDEWMAAQQEFERWVR